MARGQQQPLKSLNKGPGSRRFVFKSAAEQVDELEIDVFRSLDLVKFEPTQGSSFFHESLNAWRELNSAADFTEVYLKLIPLVQTLPQLVLHKDEIVKVLLSHVKIGAKLSLQPILSLVSQLARDLGSEFVPYVQSLVQAFVGLLEDGGAQDPDVLKHVFESLSFVLKYTNDFLRKDLPSLLRVTKPLRLYPESHVQGFCAEAVAYLLRNCSLKQLRKGIRFVFTEAVNGASEEAITAASMLIGFTLKGSSSSLHSRADHVVSFMLDSCLISGFIQTKSGRKTLCRLMSRTFLSLLEENHHKKLEPLWAQLVDLVSTELSECSFPSAIDSGAGKPENNGLDGAGPINDRVAAFKVESMEPEEGSCNRKVLDDKPRLTLLLTLLNSIVEYRQGQCLTDFKPLFSLVPRLIQLKEFSFKSQVPLQEFPGPLAPSKLLKDSHSRLSAEIFRFILALVRSHSPSGDLKRDPASIAAAAPAWVIVFRNVDAARLLSFIKGLVNEGLPLALTFAPDMLNALDRLVETYPMQVLPLLADLCRKLGQKHSSALVKCIVSGNRLVSFIIQIIQAGVRQLSIQGMEGDTEYTDPALLWVALECFPFAVSFQEQNGQLAWEYASALDQFLESAGGKQGFVEIRKCLLGSALAAHVKVLQLASPSHFSSFRQRYLSFALRHGEYTHVLRAVVDFLEASQGDENASSSELKVYPGDLGTDATVEFIKNLHVNLGSSVKSLRVATLQMLCHFEPLRKPGIKSQEHDTAKDGDSQGQPRCQVVQQLLYIESAPFCLENSRKIVLQLSHIRADLCAGRIPTPYVVPLVYAMIGLMHNRFLPLWDGAVECLARLVESHSTVVWEVFTQRLEEQQRLFLLKGNEVDSMIPPESTGEDVWSCFDRYVSGYQESTSEVSLLVLFLKTLQKIPGVAERRSRDLVPLFLVFVGHEDQCDGDCASSKAVGGKDWKSVIKEWLVLLKEMKNARSLYRSPTLKNILLKQFLMDKEPAIQQLALECLLNWKDSFLTVYRERLMNLISYKTLREELATWNIGRESKQVTDEHRDGLIPVLLRILFPKIMKRGAKIFGKAVAGVQRSVILGFLSHLDAEELAPFFSFIVRPLQAVFAHRNGAEQTAFDWEEAMGKRPVYDFIQEIDVNEVVTLPHKRKIGFLHMLQDLLGTFDSDRLGVYLPPLLALVLKFMDASLQQGDDDATRVPSGIQNMHHTNQLATQSFGGVCIEAVSEDACTKLEASETSEDLKQVGGGTPMEIQIILTNCPEPEPVKRLETAGVSIPEVCNECETYPSKPGCMYKVGDDNFGVQTSCEKYLPSASAKEVRRICYSIMAAVLTKYGNINLPERFWDIFFKCTRVSMGRPHLDQSMVTASIPLCDCFLAMSRSQDLAPLLTRDGTVIPHILAMLSSKGTSATSVPFVLSFVDNIFNLEDEAVGEDNLSPVKLVLLPHFHALIAGLKDVLLGHAERSRGSKPGHTLKLLLQILTRLSRFIHDTAEAASLVDMLLSLLKRKRRLQNEEFLEVLCAVSGLSKIVDVRTANKCLLALAPLLVSEYERDVQAVICQIFQGLAVVIPQISSTMKLVEDLMARSARGLDEIDFERRLNAYERLTAGAFGQMTWSEALLILSIAVRDVAADDISLRYSSSTCLKVFIQFAATLPDQLDVMDVDGETAVPDANAEFHFSSARSEEGTPEATDAVLSESRSVKSLVRSFLLPHARKAMNSSLVMARREWVSLIREMILEFPSIPSLHECQPLTSKDLEVDFFYNVVHLQVHRRIRAMGRFRSFLSGCHLSQGVLLRLFAPLFMSSLFEARKDKEGNLVGAAIESIACIAAELPWDPYFGLLMHCFRLVVSKPEHQKVLAKLISSILDQFHFSTAQGAGSDAKDETGVDDREVVDVANHTKDQPHEISEKYVLSPEISRALQKKVLPEVRKLMTLETNIVNASLAVAVVKILKLLPEETMEIELPSLVQSIVNLLKNRRQAVRDEARAVLVIVVQALGARFLHFVIKIMQSSLTRGFELHVLGYTTNTMLLKLLPALEVGEVDHCVDQLLGILFSVYLGEVAEEKDAEGIARKMKETRRVQSLESLQLLAKSVTFQTHAKLLLEPVLGCLESSLAPKDKVKIQLILRAMAAGILGNESVKEEELLVFIQELLEQGLKETQGVHNVASSYLKQNFHMITEFSVDLLAGNLKALKLSSQQQHVFILLAPFVDLLQKCLTSKYDAVVSGALKCLCYLIRFPLTNLKACGAKLTSDVLTIAQRFGIAECDVMKASFNLLIKLIKHQEVAEVSEHQLHMLLEFPIFIELEGRTCSTALKLLKAVVGRKLVVPELYDLMKKVEQLMIRSQVEGERKLCSQIMLQFLLDYPVGPRRLQQHLDFIICNIGYKETSGREAALDMLHTVISKFPEELIEEQAESMFLALVTRLANDEANHVRAMSATVLKVLVLRLSLRSLDRMFEFSFSWYQGDNHLLWRPAAQVLGYLIEVMGDNFEKFRGSVISAVVAFLKHAKKLRQSKGDTGTCGGEKAPLWQEIYLSLLMVEKLLQKNPDLCLGEVLERIWDLIPSFLLHQHSWVRKVCARLLGVYFAACGSQDRRLQLAKPGSLIHPKKLIQLTSAFLEQLESPSLDDDMANLVVQNLLVVIILFLSLKESGLTMQQDLSSSKEEATHEEDDLEDVDSQSDVVHLVFKKVERIALRVHPVQTKAALEWFRVITSQLGENVQAYLLYMLRPLYKISSGYAAKPVTEELRLLGEEVTNLLREVIGTHRFETAYNDVRDKVRSRRDERKESNKTFAVKDPEGSAKRKLRLTSKKQAWKRRKILESKVVRGL